MVPVVRGPYTPNMVLDDHFWRLKAASIDGRDIDVARVTLDEIVRLHLRNPLSASLGAMDMLSDGSKRL